LTMAGPVVDLDVSDLEPPEPLLRTLAALKQLPEGHYLRMIHRMKPHLLYEHLPDLGFLADTREGRDGRCEVYLWREGDAAAAQAASQAAAGLPPWRE